MAKAPVIRIINGTNAANRISGTKNNDIINGLGGHDTLDGGEGDDSLFGGDGDDVLIGGLGNDLVAGGAGFDWANYGSATRAVNVNLTTGTATGAGTDSLQDIEAIIGSRFNDRLTGDARDNAFRGGLGSDVIDGLAGHDTLDGGEGADSLFGGDGDDVLIGGLGNDLVAGGTGIDWADYGSATRAVNVNLTTGTATGAGTDSLQDIEAIIGSIFNDTLTGDARDNTIRGGLGDDVIHGGPETSFPLTFILISDLDVADYSTSASAVNVNLATGVATGEGNDTLINIENAWGSQFADTLVGNAKDNRFFGGLGNDFIDGGDGTIDIVDYGYVNTGGISANLLTGVVQAGAGDVDTIVQIEGVAGTAFGDVMIGTSARDRFIGRGGDDTIIGNGGGDYVSYIDAAGPVTVDLRIGTSSGPDGNDSISGVSGILGSKFGDSLYAGTSGNATVRGGLGDDTMFGGPGNDILDFNGPLGLGGVSVNLVSGTSSGAHGNDVFSGFERVRTLDGNDTIVGDAGNNEFTVGLGSNVVIGGDGIDTINYADDLNGALINLVTGIVLRNGTTDQLTGIEGVTASAGNDTILGTLISERLFGNGGNDSLAGEGGADFLDGADGNDTLEGGADNDLLRGQSGDDSLAGGDGSDYLDGGADNDFLVGGEGNDQLTGGPGDDSLSGGQGDDTITADGLGSNVLDGGAGIDSLSYAITSTSFNIDLASELAIFASGSDVVAGFERVRAGTGDDTLLGTQGDEDFDGGAGDDSLAGRDGNDWLTGGDGNDVIWGGLGIDGMTGGLGADTFVFAAIEEANPPFHQGATDAINDFSSLQGDRIDVSGIDGDGANGLADTFSFIGTAEFSGTAGELRYDVQGTVQGDGSLFEYTQIYGDIDGDAQHDFMIFLPNVQSLSSGDFFL